MIARLRRISLLAVIGLEFLKINSVVYSDSFATIVGAVPVERRQRHYWTAEFRTYRRGGMRLLLKRTYTRCVSGILLSRTSLRRWPTSARRHTHTHKKRITVRYGAAFRRTMLNRAINSMRLGGLRSSVTGRHAAPVIRNISILTKARGWKTEQRNKDVIGLE